MHIIIAKEYQPFTINKYVKRSVYERYITHFVAFSHNLSLSALATIDLYLTQSASISWNLMTYLAVKYMMKN